jgi:hypothetical protein
MYSTTDPIKGGLFSQKLSWRWLFCQAISLHPLIRYAHSNLDINLPLTAFSIIMIFFFFKFKTPTGNIRHKLSRVDWLYVVVAQFCFDHQWLSYIIDTILIFVLFQRKFHCHCWSHRCRPCTHLGRSHLSVELVPSCSPINQWCHHHSVLFLL